MVLLAQLVTEYVADLSDLMSGATRAQEIIDSFGGLTEGPSKLADSFDHAGEVARLLGEDVAAVMEEASAKLDSAYDTAMHLDSGLSDLSSSAEELGASVTDAVETFQSKLATDAVAAADQFSAKIAQAGARVGEFASGLASRAGSALSSFGQRIIATTQPVIDFGVRVGQSVSNAASVIVSRLQDAGSAVSDFASNVATRTADIASSFASNVADRVSSAANMFSSRVRQASEPVIQFGQRVGNAVSDMAGVVSSRLAPAGSAIGGFASRVASGFGQAGLVVLGFGIKAQQGMSEAASAIQSKLGVAGQAVANFGSSVRSHFDAAMGHVREFSSNMATGLSTLGQHIRSAASHFLEFGERVRSAMAPLGSFISKVREAASSVQEASEKARNAGSNFLEFGSKIGMTVFGVQNLISGAQSLAQNLLGPAAAAEQVKGSLEIFTGSAQAATQEMANLNEAAAESPFKTSDVDQFALKLQSVGISAKDVIPDFVALGDGLDAVSRTSSADLSEIADSFVKIQTQGHMTSEIMDSFATKGIDIWGVLQKQTGKTREELQSFISDGLYKADDAMRDLTVGMEASPLYHGQMKNDADVFNGALSTMQSNFEQLTASFGDPVIKALEPEIANISNAMKSPQFKEFATMVGDKIGGAVKSTASFVHDKLLPPIERFGGFIHDKVAPAVKIAAENFDKFTGAGQGLTPVLAGLGAIVAAVLVPAMASLAIEVAIATWPFLLIAGAIAGLTAIFMHFYNSNAGFRDFINNIGKAITDLWNNISTNFMPTMQKIGIIIQKDVMPFLQKMGAYISEQFQPVWKQLVDLWNTQLLPAIKTIQPYLPYLQIGFEILGGIIATYVLVNIAILIGMISGLAKGIATFVGGLSTFISGIIEFFTGVAQTASGITHFLIDLFTGKWSNLGKDLGEIWTGIQNMFKGAWDMIVGFFQMGIGTVLSFVWGLVEGVVKFFTSLYDTLIGHSIVPDMINGIIDFFWQLPGKVGDAVNSMKDKSLAIIGDLAAKAKEAGAHVVQQVADGISGAIHFVKDAVNNVTQYISDHLPHSPAKMGPLRDLAYQGEQVVGQVSEGMMRGLPHIDSAIGAMTRPISLAFSAPSAINSSSSVSPTPARDEGGEIHVHTENHFYFDGEEITDKVMKRAQKTSRKGPIRAA